MTWFERTTTAMWHNASPSDSLYETGGELCLAIMLGAVLAGLVVVLVLAARVRIGTPTQSNTANPAGSANCS